MGILPKVVEQENAVLPSSYDHIKITTKLGSNQPGELSEDWLDQKPVTKDIKQPLETWGGAETLFTLVPHHVCRIRKEISALEGRVSPAQSTSSVKRNPLNTWLCQSVEIPSRWARRWLETHSGHPWPSIIPYHLATRRDGSTRTYDLELATKLCPKTDVTKTTLNRLRYWPVSTTISAALGVWPHWNSLLRWWSLQGFFHFCTYRFFLLLQITFCLEALLPSTWLFCGSFHISAGGDVPRLPTTSCCVPASQGDDGN